MLVVEKAHRIEVEISGTGTAVVLDVLKREFPKLRVSGLPEDDDDEFESIRGSPWFDTLVSGLSPGSGLRVYRDNARMTQARLSELTGIPAAHLSGMEHDKRPIGKATAKKLAAVLHCDYRRFL